jgi:hypothetical protein
MAGTTRLELATSAVTDFTARIATLGASRNPRELLLHPNCTQIFARPVCLVKLRRALRRQAYSETRGSETRVRWNPTPLIQLTSVLRSDMNWEHVRVGRTLR